MVSKDKKGNIYDPEIDVLLWKTNGTFTEEGLKHVGRLLREIFPTTANIIIPLGATATTALLSSDKVGISKVRGSVYLGQKDEILNKKIMPTFHPAVS